jgi:uncharacterized protein (TIRG00374 family)
MSRSASLRINRRYLVLAGILLLALYVIVPQIGDFQSSWQRLRHPILAWTLLAIGLTLLTYLAAAATYVLLAFKRLRYAQVVLVELAAMFINRLLPGGVGALGANYLYLRHQRHTQSQAASVVAVNNLLGFTGHAVIVAASLLIFSTQQTVVAPRHSAAATIAFVASCVIVGLVLLATLGYKQQRLRQVLADLGRQLISYRHRPGHLGAALLSSMVLTLANVMCLYACCQAVGVTLPFIAILLIFSFGVGTGTATPTPGGLGGFEAGLVAGLVAYQIAGGPALAAALLFRLVSYWLPLAIGGLAFVSVQRRGLLAG